MTGILGNRAGLEASEAAEMLLCLGTDFAYTLFCPEKARVVQIDSDATHLARRAPVHLGLVGDVGATIDALLPLLTKKPDDSHLTTALARRGKDLEGYEDAARESDPKLILSQFVAQMLDDLAMDTAAITADGGSRWSSGSDIFRRGAHVVFF